MPGTTAHKEILSRLPKWMNVLDSLINKRDKGGNHDVHKD